MYLNLTLKCGSVIRNARVYKVNSNDNVLGEGTRIISQQLLNDLLSLKIDGEDHIWFDNGIIASAVGVEDITSYEIC